MGHLLFCKCPLLPQPRRQILPLLLRACLRMVRLQASSTVQSNTACKKRKLLYSEALGATPQHVRAHMLQGPDGFPGRAQKVRYGRRHSACGAATAAPGGALGGRPRGGGRGGPAGPPWRAWPRCRLRAPGLELECACVWALLFW